MVHPTPKAPKSSHLSVLRLDELPRFAYDGLNFSIIINLHHRVITMAQILKAKPVVEQGVERLTKECDQLKKAGVTPYMQVLLVGDNPASLIYTRNKKRYIEKLGAKCDIIHLPATSSEADFIFQVGRMVSNDEVHGCFIQLPLPSQLSHVDVGELIPAEKDVDGFNQENLMGLLAGDCGENVMLPCTPKGIITLLRHYKIEIEGKNVVIIGRSMIVGKPMAMLLTNYNATVTICHSRTKNLNELAANADIIIAAIGKAKMVNTSYISPNRNQVVVDVGMNQDEDGKLCGDVDFNKVSEITSAITPVPGGVGPMTILSLAENLIRAATVSREENLCARIKSLR
jgi:methylenetetrahydrofolate dehydrogenase (NADP+) / methenyltetrahydrofolate cyclohydrolase